MNAQIDNLNGQVKNDNSDPEVILTIIFKYMAQVMQQNFAEKSLQKSKSEQQLSQQINKLQNNLKVNPIRSSLNNNQINNDPLQGLRNILMSQLFKLYNSPNQNRQPKILKNN